MILFLPAWNNSISTSLKWFIFYQLEIIHFLPAWNDPILPAWNNSFSTSLKLFLFCQNASCPVEGESMALVHSAEAVSRQARLPATHNGEIRYRTVHQRNCAYKINQYQYDTFCTCVHGFLNFKPALLKRKINIVRHVTGNDQDYLGESPEWLFRYLLLL